MLRACSSAPEIRPQAVLRFGDQTARHSGRPCPVSGRSEPTEGGAARGAGPDTATVAPVHARSGPAGSGRPAGSRARRFSTRRHAPVAPTRRTTLLSSRHAAGRTRTVRREDPADPHRGRRPQPARDPRRAAPGGRLRRPDRPRRRRGPSPAEPGLAGPARHRHAHAPHGRADARPRGQGPRRSPDHRPVRHRHRGLQGRPARRGCRGLRHQALPLPGAAGTDPAGPPASGRPRAAPAPGAGAQPGPRARIAAWPRWPASRSP